MSRIIATLGGADIYQQAQYQIIMYHQRLNVMVVVLQEFASVLDRQWVRDNVITFYFEYLVRVEFPTIAKDVAMLDVSTGFLLKQLGAASHLLHQKRNTPLTSVCCLPGGPEEAVAILGPLNLEQKVCYSA